MYRTPPPFSKAGADVILAARESPAAAHAPRAVLVPMAGAPVNLPKPPPTSDRGRSRQGIVDSQKLRDDLIVIPEHPASLWSAVRSRNPEVGHPRKKSDIPPKGMTRRPGDDRSHDPVNQVEHGSPLE
jgi:hypothetical protein